MAELFESCPRYWDPRQKCCGREALQTFKSIVEESQVRITETETNRLIILPVYALRSITKEEKEWIGTLRHRDSLSWLLGSNHSIATLVDDKFPVLKKVHIPFLPDCPLNGIA